MANAYYTLARRIFTTEFDSQTGITSLSQISGWLSANIGQLNDKLHTNFTGECSDMDESAGSIFSLMYLRDYNKKASRNALRGVQTAGGNVLSIADGDNKISFVNTKELAKEFQAAAKDYSEEIDKLAYNYSYYNASPRQLVGWESYPTGSGYYYYN